MTSNITINTNALQILVDLLVTDYNDVKKVVLCDTNTRRYCLPLLEKTFADKIEFDVIEIGAGEIIKNIETVCEVWKTLLNFGADRKAVLLNLGGGVVTDLGGFVASTFKRGIDFINIPTTLLAQVDASVGAKTGIDFEGSKNQIGTFTNPKAVFIDEDFLKTLPPKEKLSGFAEIIKHALICDKAYWQQILSEGLYGNQNLTSLIERSITIKQQIVQQDPLEQNIRKLLNFGHTIGHALESLSLQRDEIPLLHGECVAIGMVCEAYISHKQVGLSEDQLMEITGFINDHYSFYAVNGDEYHHLFEFMRNDKKNRGSEINFTLLKQIGEGEINQQVDFDIIVQSLEFYRNTVSH